jgi:hypothetical protein
MFWKFPLLNGSCTTDISYYLQVQLDVLKVPFAERLMYNGYLVLSAGTAWCSESSLCWTVPVQRISRTICRYSLMFWKFPLLNGSCTTDISYCLQCQLDVSWNDSDVFFLRAAADFVWILLVAFVSTSSRYSDEPGQGSIPGKGMMFLFSIEFRQALRSTQLLSNHCRGLWPWK